LGDAIVAKNIIYHCYGGAHSSVVAAAVHLGTLKTGRTPDNEKLMELTLFDRQGQDAHGQLHFLGFDEEGRHIYSVGCRNAGSAVEKTLSGMAEIFKLPDEFIFVDTLRCVNIKMRIGGYLSRRWGLIKVGRPLVLQGTRQAFQSIVGLVDKTKKEVGR
jgi:hypothetical protein